MVLASQANFGLEELAGIDTGAKNKGSFDKKAKLDELMEVYEKIKGQYKDFMGFMFEDVVSVHDQTAKSLEKTSYSERDICELVEYGNILEFQNDAEEAGFGMYVGSLITVLTERNEKQGKRTVIDIPENHLKWLGNHCFKFDIIKIGKNYGDWAFYKAREGDLLYIDKCEGESFAYGAAFAYFDGTKGHINFIVANELNGRIETCGYASNVGDIIINKSEFEYPIDLPTKKMSKAGSSEAKEKYNRIMKEYEWCLK
jgi:hypothetical protein